MPRSEETGVSCAGMISPVAVEMHIYSYWMTYPTKIIGKVATAVMTGKRYSKILICKLQCIKTVCILLRSKNQVRVWCYILSALIFFLSFAVDRWMGV
jgi:hypothetical protein